MPDYTPEELKHLTNTYQTRQTQKAENAKQRAAKLREEGTARVNKSSDFFRGIQGQPMLPGHHSYKSDRNRRAKMSANYDKGHEQLAAADRLDNKANKIGRGGIASDDPTAVTQLKAKLAALEEDRERIKLERKAMKRITGAMNPRAADLTQEQREEVKAEFGAAGLTPDFCGRLGVEAFQLTNLTNRIKTVKTRILELSEHDLTEELAFTGQGWEIGADDGRVWAKFASKDTLTHDQRRALLPGWQWSRTNGRFQRKDTPNARTAANTLAAKLGEELGQAEESNS